MAALNRRRLQVILNQVPNTLHFLGVEAVILSQSQKQLPSENWPSSEEILQTWLGCRQQIEAVVRASDAQLVLQPLPLEFTIFEQHISSRRRNSGVSPVSSRRAT